MERVQVNGMDNLCWKLSSRSFQLVVSVPLGADCWQGPIKKLDLMLGVSWWGFWCTCLLTIRIGLRRLAHIGLKSSKPAIVRGIKFQMWFHIDFGPIVQVASRRQWETKLSSNRSTKSLSRSIIIMRAVPYFRHTNSFSLLECTYYVGFYFYYDSDFFVFGRVF